MGSIELFNFDGNVDGNDTYHPAPSALVHHTIYFGSPSVYTVLN